MFGSARLGYVSSGLVRLAHLFMSKPDISFMSYDWYEVWVRMSFAMLVLCGCNISASVENKRLSTLHKGVLCCAEVVNKVMILFT